MLLVVRKAIVEIPLLMTIVFQTDNCRFSTTVLLLGSLSVSSDPVFGNSGSSLHQSDALPVPSGPGGGRLFIHMIAKWIRPPVHSHLYMCLV